MAVAQIVLLRHGYQIGLDVLSALQMGTQQTRNRVFIRGARWDEVLPNKPRQTHLVSNLSNFTIGEDAKSDRSRAKYLRPGESVKEQDKAGCCDENGQRLRPYNGRLARAPSLNDRKGHPTILSDPMQVPLWGGPDFRQGTIEELRRLQSVAKSIKLQGSPASQLQQIANAVPMTFGEAFACEFRKAAHKSEQRKAKAKRRKEKADVIVVD
ncbi:hypothetical protein HDV00_012018 [Rhizophlyctis rosea]|nr:hypothetical protein HDV00_012018 [Rhizophlyctis rosea]